METLELGEIIISLSTKNIILVDGFNGSGKSYLAQELSKSLAVPTLDLDDYIIKTGGNHYYVDRLDLDKLYLDIVSKNPIIVSGACILDVFSILNLKFDSHIYVKRISGSNWHDGLDLEDYHSQNFDPNRQVCTFKYHKLFEPHLVANVVYSRHE
ncbi:hypothetical protein WNY51_12225 [Pseudocolwellia sp. AS88]|uniref:hypothetical protein n=1 Tax=Pseudocolwellia sp. AS88 TaxID=3063958 RepID=UPI0026EA28B2|nr:hypothetical protein [Pseudocolwellia sp. AS88]MDO7085229.1 hypothetical protein [Pseudocolwellia sp. AS88]